MEWLRATVLTGSAGVEHVCGLLYGLGVSGLEIIDDYDSRVFLENNPQQWDYADERILSAAPGEAAVVFYIRPDEAGLIDSVREGLNALRESAEEDGYIPAEELGALTVSTERADDSEWKDAWKDHFLPFRIGKNVVVRPVWEEIPPGMLRENDAVFTIDPGYVFGTGLHQSTRMCVEAAEAVGLEGFKVLDIGCGSGILSLTALLLGAESALAVDNDPQCAEAAERNAELNGMYSPRFEAVTGDMLTDAGFLGSITPKDEEGRYGVVFANIVADVIIGLSDIVPGLIKTGGAFISSGIINGRVGDVLEALSKNGFESAEVKRDGEWACIVSRYGTRP